MSHEADMILCDEVAHCKTEDEVREFMSYRGRSPVIIDRVVGLWLENHCCADHEDNDEPEKVTKVVIVAEKTKKTKKKNRTWGY